MKKLHLAMLIALVSIPLSAGNNTTQATASLNPTDMATLENAVVARVVPTVIERMRAFFASPTVVVKSDSVMDSGAGFWSLLQYANIKNLVLAGYGATIFATVAKGMWEHQKLLKGQEEIKQKLAVLQQAVQSNHSEIMGDLKNRCDALSKKIDQGNTRLSELRTDLANVKSAVDNAFKKQDEANEAREKQHQQERASDRQKADERHNEVTAKIDNYERCSAERNAKIERDLKGYNEQHRAALAGVQADNKQFFAQQNAHNNKQSERLDALGCNVKEQGVQLSQINVVVNQLLDDQQKTTQELTSKAVTLESQLSKESEARRAAEELAAKKAEELKKQLEKEAADRREAEREAAQKAEELRKQLEKQAADRRQAEEKAARDNSQLLSEVQCLRAECRRFSVTLHKVVRLAQQKKQDDAEQKRRTEELLRLATFGKLLDNGDHIVRINRGKAIIVSTDLLPQIADHASEADGGDSRSDEETAFGGSHVRRRSQPLSLSVPDLGSFQQPRRGFVPNTGFRFHENNGQRSLPRLMHVPSSNATTQQ